MACVDDSQMLVNLHESLVIDAIDGAARIARGRNKGRVELTPQDMVTYLSEFFTILRDRSRVYPHDVSLDVSSNLLFFFNKATRMECTSQDSASSHRNRSRCDPD
jgi:hypothetical protein